MLERTCGNRARVQSEAGWTGTNEKAAKDQCPGAYNPNGSHVIALALHSDEVLTTFLAMVGHEDLAVTITPAPAEVATADLPDTVR